MRPSPKMLYERTMRLISEKPLNISKEKEQKEKLRTTRDIEFATLSGLKSFCTVFRSNLIIIFL